MLPGFYCIPAQKNGLTVFLYETGESTKTLQFHVVGSGIIVVQHIGGKTFSVPFSLTQRCCGELDNDQTWHVWFEVVL